MKYDNHIPDEELAVYVAWLEDRVEERDLSLMGVTDYYNPETHTTVPIAVIDDLKELLRRWNTVGLGNRLPG